jgi:hypothetical protein
LLLKKRESAVTDPDIHRCTEAFWLKMVEEKKRVLKHMEQSMGGGGGNGPGEYF